MADKISIDEKFSKFTEHWRPKIVAELNGQQFKLAKIKGDYPFHAHEEEDEMFFCWKGAFILDIKRSASLNECDNAQAVEVISTYVGEGEAIVVPRGVVHRPRAEDECQIFLIEPKGVKNSGDATVDAVYDAPIGEWV